jgi:hypothetical protein
LICSLPRDSGRSGPDLAKPMISARLLFFSFSGFNLPEDTALGFEI